MNIDFKKIIYRDLINVEKMNAFSSFVFLFQLVAHCVAPGFRRSVMKVRPPPGGPMADAMTFGALHGYTA